MRSAVKGDTCNCGVSCLPLTWQTLKLWSQPPKVACSAAGRRIFSKFRPGTERRPPGYCSFLGESLGRRWSFSAELKFGGVCSLFTRHPKYARCMGGQRPGTDLMERSLSSDLGQKSKPLGQRLQSGRSPVAGRSPLWDQSVTGRRVPSSVSSLWPSGFDFWPKSLGGERSISSVPRRRTAGHWAYFGAPPITGRPPCNIFKISRRPVEDCSGNRWVTGRSLPGHRAEKLHDFASFDLKSTGEWREIDRAPPRHRWGSTACSTSPKIAGRWPKFQRRPRRLLIGRSPLWFCDHSFSAHCLHNMTDKLI